MPLRIKAFIIIMVTLLIDFRLFYILILIGFGIMVAAIITYYGRLADSSVKGDNDE